MTTPLCAEVLAKGRNEGHDDAEPDEVNEDREEDDQNGGFSHAGTAKTGSQRIRLILK